MERHRQMGRPTHGERIEWSAEPEAKVVAFSRFGEALYGGPYDDTQSLESVLKPQCLLASMERPAGSRQVLRRSAAPPRRKPARVQNGQMG